MSNSSENSTMCDCHDKQHQQNNKHRHIGNECIHENNARHTIHHH
jgi:hypothetical protein